MEVGKEICSYLRSLCLYYIRSIQYPRICAHTHICIYMHMYTHTHTQWLSECFVVMLSALLY